MNEAIRLRQICLVTDRMEEVLDVLIATFGWQVCYGKGDLTRYGVPQRDPPDFQKKFFEGLGFKSAILPVGDTFLELVAPVTKNNAARRFLDRRGPGGYMVITEVGDTEPFDARRTQKGWRLAGEVDYPTYHELQNDPRDIGGAILSFSQQREGKPFDGGWFPAGPDKLEKTVPGYGGIIEATVSAPDPAEIAGRWSRLIGRAVAIEGESHAIALDRGRIRFAPGEGKPRLSAIRILAEDISGALARAQAAGLEVASHNGIRVENVTIMLDAA